MKVVQVQLNRQDVCRASGSASLASRGPLARPLEQHQRIATHLGAEAATRRRVLIQTSAELISTSRRVHPRAQLNGRIKSVGSISDKMFYTGVDIHQVLDIIGIRVIFQTTRDCYRLVKRIHDKFAFIEQEYDDYIATPKANGYQSIHTTVISSCGLPVEIQIRTQEMHRLVEHGSASHRQYKNDRVLRYRQMAWIDPPVQAASSQETGARPWLLLPIPKREPPRSHLTITAMSATHT